MLWQFFFFIWFVMHQSVLSRNFWRKKLAVNLPPTPPSGLRSSTPHALGLRTLVTLVSVWFKIAKNFFRLFSTYFLLKSCNIFRKDMHCSENDFLFHEFFSCATASFWDMVDIIYGWFCKHEMCHRLYSGSIDHTQNRTYIKNKNSHEKNHQLKIYCMINAQLSCKFSSCWTTFFLSVAHLKMGQFGRKPMANLRPNVTVNRKCNQP